MVDTPGAEIPSSPDITHVDPSAEKSWMGHPRQLARLFSVEMWERFGFYGMRALLVLYLTKHFLIADYQVSDHANDLPRVRNAVWDVALDWLAAGLDPDDASFVIESGVPEHAELTPWLAW